MLSILILYLCTEQKSILELSAPTQAEFKIERWESISWSISITLDAATTYRGIKLGLIEKGPLYNFDRDTKFGEILLQVAATDAVLQYVLWKTTKRKTIRVHITTHYIAATWNFSQH